MPHAIVHARRLRRVGLVAAALFTIVGFVALLASPAMAADAPAPEGATEPSAADAPARAALPPPAPSSPPGPAVPGPVDGEARGAPDVAEPAASGTGRRRWYGWQTLLTDGSALALMLVPIGDRRDRERPLVAVSGLTYALGGPVVHLAHERPLAALGSVGMRVGLPVLGAAIGSAADRGCEEVCVQAGLLAVLGLGTAIAVDAAVLAREPAPSRPRPRSDASPVGRLAPSVAPRREGGVDVGLAGAF